MVIVFIVGRLTLITLLAPIKWGMIRHRSGEIPEYCRLTSYPIESPIVGQRYENVLYSIHLTYLGFIPVNTAFCGITTESHHNA